MLGEKNGNDGVVRPGGVIGWVALLEHRIEFFNGVRHGAVNVRREGHCGSDGDDLGEVDVSTLLCG